MVRKWCFVPNCTSTSAATPNKRFITVPVNENRKRLWFKAARRDYPLTKSSFYVCEDHFKLEEDVENYVRFQLMGGPIYLKKHVVPHIFDCQEDRKRLATPRDRSAVLKRKRIELVQEALESTQGSSSTNSSVKLDFSSSSEIEINNDAVATCSSESPAQTKSIGIQCTPYYASKGINCKISNKAYNKATSPIKISTSDAITSPIKHLSHTVDSQLICNRSPLSNSSMEDDTSSYTSEFANSDDEFVDSNDSNDSNSEIIYSNAKVASLNSTLFLISQNPKSYIGVPTFWFKPFIDYLVKQSSLTKEQIFLSLMKIKVNDGFDRLGNQFNWSEGHSSRVFAQTVPILAHFLKTLIYWPQKATNKKLLPVPFRTQYSNVQSIIDCFEVEIQKPTNSLKQSLTWSQYKKCNTVKYLISATPDGFINFISTGYGGRTSDSVIVEQSGYLDELSPGCTVMADSGFKNVQNLIEEQNCTLVKPPSVYSNLKPDKHEVLLPKRIARLRIHIERVIRRVREFEFLKPHSVIHHKLLDNIDDIVIIVCALINLQSPIIQKL